MATTAFKPARSFLIGSILTVLLAGVAFFPRAEVTNARDSVPAGLDPVFASSAAQPTKPDTVYVCDWKRPGSNGMSEIKFEYTRQMPQNGWLGKIHTKYPNGSTRVDDSQFYDAKAKPKLGHEWGFQTTDGKTICKMNVGSGGAEVRFGDCNTRVEQYCVDERILKVADALRVPECLACKSKGSFDKVTCINKCFKESANQPDLTNCSTSPVGCMVITMWKKIGLGGIWEIDGRIITENGLDELRQTWIDFVNHALGDCTSSTFCPLGTSAAAKVHASNGASNCQFNLQVR